MQHETLTPPRMLSIFHLTVVLIVAWSLLFTALLVWSYEQHQQTMFDAAYTEAYAHLNKDQAMRLWAIEHKRIYVPESDRARADPYLKHIPERDITTPTGQRLTLINPATIMRQLNEEYGEILGVPARITSLRPLRPGNAPDHWEQSALQALENGAEEFSTFSRIDGKEHLRLMRPMVISENCLHCHGHQGYRIGDVGGGVAVAVPLAPLQDKAVKEFGRDAVRLGFIWVLGLVAIGFGGHSLHRRDINLRHGEMRKSAILESALDCIITIDCDGKIIEFNPAAEKTFGYEKVQVMGGDMAELLIPPELRQQHHAGFARHMADGEQHILNRRIETEAMRADGERFPVELAVTRIDSARKPLFTAYLRDISESRRAAEALRESERRYALAANGANDGLWDWDLRSGEVYYSERWLAIAGIDVPHTEHDPDTWFSRVHPDDLPQLKSELRAHTQGHTQHFSFEHRMLHQDGRYRWVLSRGAAIFDDNGQAHRIAGSLTDITERKLTEEQLRHEALHDSLTGLSNRSFFMKQLDRAISLAQRNPDYRFAVLFLDLDRFKVVNDSLGHLLGDELLLTTAHRLGRCVRAADLVARFGGDEFTVLLEDVEHIEKVTHMAERILGALSQSLNLAGHEVFTTASIGITTSDQEYRSSEEALRDADAAMYQAKREGKARYALFDPRLHRQALAQLHMEEDLHRAIDAGEFHMLYQPVIDVHSGRISGFEALIRWHHPEHGQIKPADFIPVAEETGLIIPIGEWVLNESLRQHTAWQNHHATPLWISINVSGKQLLHSDLPQQVRAALEAHQVAPESVKLELTESLFLESRDEVTGALNDLKRLGVQLSIDDFGTGYSAMSYLHRLPIDALKIDRSFVNRIESDGLETVRAIINLAKNLGLSLVAEGVENSQQLNHLRALGCPHVQGYHFSRPLEPREAEVLLLEKQRWFV